MKKSVLWTTAGVVSAAAIWAAISLPQHPNSSRGARLTKTARSLSIHHPTQAQRVCNLFIKTNLDERGSLNLRGSDTSYTAEWDGKQLRVRSTSNSGFIGWSSLKRPITLTITKQLTETGPGFMSSKCVTFSRTLQPGEKLDI